MKHSKSEVHWKARALPAIRFEDQQLTSFAGLISLSTRSRAAAAEAATARLFRAPEGESDLRAWHDRDAADRAPVDRLPALV